MPKLMSKNLNLFIFIRYSVPAHYYLAQALVQQGAQKFKDRKPRDECVHFQERALKLLEEAQMLIKNNLLPWVGAQLAGRCADNIGELMLSEYAPQMSARVQLLNMLYGQCEMLTKVLREDVLLSHF